MKFIYINQISWSWLRIKQVNMKLTFYLFIYLFIYLLIVLKHQYVFNTKNMFGIKFSFSFYV